MILKHQRKKLDNPIKINFNHKRLYPSKSVKYRSIKIDENLNWKQHIHVVAIKPNKPMPYYLQLEIMLINIFQEPYTLPYLIFT